MSLPMDLICAEIERHPHAFDFDRDRLGDDLAEITAAAIFAFMDAGIGPDNNPWIDLSLSYAAWKSAHYPGRDISELDLVMKAPDQLKGELAIAAGTMVQTYGTDEVARLHAVWFQEGNEHQPPGPSTTSTTWP